MESTLEKIDFESDEESPLTLSQSAGAKQSFQFETSSHTSVPKFRTLRKLQFTAFHSVYVVLFKAKINVLLPFGPLAVLMHYMTGRHVRIFSHLFLSFFSMTLKLKILILMYSSSSTFLFRDGFSFSAYWELHL